MTSRWLPFVVLLALAACSGNGGGGSSANPLAPSPTAPTTGDTGTTPSATSPPSGLAMPIRVDDINLRGVINPFGIVRGSLDRAGVGHPGIDIPLNTGAPIFAVGDGRIVSVRPSIDFRPGSLVKILLAADPTPGSGWIFLYEHVTLLGGLGVGSDVTRGQQIATNPMEPAYGNHLELSHAFSDYEFLENQTCWVNQLDGASRSEFMSQFNTQLRTDPRFVSAWETVTMEGRLPFRELLNPAKYPDGARLCYPTGTDERVDP